MNSVGLAIVGCGNVASFYCGRMFHHPILQLLGVTDCDDRRSSAYSEYYSVRKYESLDDVLDDKRVELVLNLTNPRSHYTISKACLEAGKHVYSEKPLAMSFREAKELVALAESKELYIASAPSRVMAETAQTMWRALQDEAVGKIRAVYAEMDGGMIHRLPYREWANELGMHWPYNDEFRVGCTVEHAGYSVSWLSAFFGPVASVTAIATRQVNDFSVDFPPDDVPPDLTIAGLKFKSGVFARLTSSWIAPPDHSIRVFGDAGVLSTDDIWSPRSPVRVTRTKSIRVGPKAISLQLKKKYPMVSTRDGVSSLGKLRLMMSPAVLVRELRARFWHLRSRVDFCLGPAELATALRERRRCWLTPEYCLHNTEVVLAIHDALATGTHYPVETSFAPMSPLPCPFG